MRFFRFTFLGHFAFWDQTHLIMARHRGAVALHLAHAVHVGNAGSNLALSTVSISCKYIHNWTYTTNYSILDLIAAGLHIQMLVVNAIILSQIIQIDFFKMQQLCWKIIFDLTSVGMDLELNKL